MTQEESKRFLTSKTPKEKFNFFKLGTSLAQIERNYTDTAKILRDDANDVALTKSAVEDLKDQERKASKKLTDLSRAREKDDKIKQAIKNLVWCPVKKNETDLAAKEQQILHAEDRVKKHSEAREEEQKKLEEAQKQMSDKKSEVDRFQSEQTELKEKLRPLKQAETQAKSAITSAQKKITDAEKQIQEYEQDIGRIEEERLINADTTKREQLVAKRKRIKDIQDEMLPALNDRMERLQAEEAEHTYQKEELERQAFEWKNRISKIGYKIETAKTDYDHYKKRQNKAQDGFQ